MTTQTATTLPTTCDDCGLPVGPDDTQEEARNRLTSWSPRPLCLHCEETRDHNGLRWDWPTDAEAASMAQ